MWDNVWEESTTLAAILNGVRLQLKTTGLAVNKVIDTIFQWMGALETSLPADNHARSISIKSKIKY